MVLGCITGLLIAFLVSGLHLAGVFERSELRTLDLRFLLRFLLDQSSGQDASIVIVAIDERSLAAVGSWPWSWAVQAQLVDALAKAGARGIGLGYVLPQGANGDPGYERFRQAVAASSTVVLGAAFQSSDDLLPPAGLVEAAASVGVLNLEPDRDGVVRRIVPRYRALGLEPFAVAYARAAGVQGETTVSSQLINYRPPANAGRLQLHRWFPTVSAADVLSGVVSSYIDGRWVLVGVTDPIAGELYNTPLMPQVPDIYVHGFALRAWLIDDHIRSAGVAATLLAVLATGVVTAAFAFLLRPWALTLGALLGAAASTLVAVWAFVRWSVWLPVVPVLVVQAASYVSGLIYAFTVVERDTRRIRRLFQRYVEPAVVERLLLDPRAAEAGRRARVTVLFADLRGFTAFAERNSPEVVVSTLDRYLQVMAEAILTHGGMVDKYIGDAVMALFGAPLPNADHAQAALAAAFAIRRSVAELNEREFKGIVPALDVGIGVHTGEAVVGSIGSERRREYTAIGDVVNVASRLEEAARPGEILASHATLRAAGLEPTGFARELTLRGRTDPVLAYSISGWDELAAAASEGVQTS